MALVLDYNNDGKLDIFLLNGALYANSGDGTFTDASSKLKVGAYGAKSATAGDYDDDGDVDIYVVRDGRENILYRNYKNRTFSDIAEQAGVNYEGRCEFTTSVDYDNDGDLDIYVVNHDSPNLLYRNNGDDTFTDVSAEAGVDDELRAKAANFLDCDNDGDLDIYVVNYNEPDLLYINNEDGTFSKRADPPLPQPLSETERGVSYLGETAAFADFDNDGDVDIYVVNRNEPGLLYLNSCSGAEPPNNNWLHVKVIGTVSNTDSLGAKVTVVSEGLKQIREVRANSGRHSDSLPVEFGLGKRTEVQQVKIEWPSGMYLISNDVSVNQLLVVEEPEGVIPVTWGQLKSELLPNYPNPSNPETWIPYRLAEQADVKIQIYNALGQLVRTLSLGNKRAGEYVTKDKAAYWDGRNDKGEKTASGIYFYHLDAGHFKATRKMLVMK